VISARSLRTLQNADIDFVPSDTILRRAGSIPVSDTAGIRQNPSLKYVQQQVQISRREKDLELSRIWPDLSIGYFNQTIRGTQEVNGVPRIFGPGDRFTGVQAGIAIPIWIVPFTSKARAAKINEDIARSDAEYFAKSLSSSYRSMLDEYDKYSSSVEYYEKQAIPEANLIIDQSSKSYKAGEMDYLEYVMSLNRALDLKQKYLDALDNFNQVIIRIEYLTGKTL
jgi:cobalt-zinc-cadmium resistance protein CzcA